MLTKMLMINASTRTGRIEMTSRAERAIAETGGWITDFKQFSNVSVCINFEISGKNVGRLRPALEAIDLRLTKESEAALSNYGGPDRHPPVTPGEQDISGTLQITFIHNEPDLRRDVPAIPG